MSLLLWGVSSTMLLPDNMLEQTFLAFVSSLGHDERHEARHLGARVEQQRERFRGIEKFLSSPPSSRQLRSTMSGQRSRGPSTV